MKFRFFIAVAALVGIAACKSPYKATDRTRSSTDTTSTATDTSATMNKANTPDTSGVSRMDSTKIDPTTKQFPDSVRSDTIMRSDTTNRTFQDTSRVNPMDSTRRDTTGMQSPADSAKTTPPADTTSARSQAPPELEPVFSKQYPAAANAVWSHYDSLAAVPIDMRLTGWKGLDPEDHMVKFDFEDETYYAWYDSKGKWIGSAYTMKDISKLPPKVNAAIKNAMKTRYAGYEISQVNRELQTGKSAYEVQLTKDDNEVRMLVTPAGKITQIFKYSKQKSK